MLSADALMLIKAFHLENVYAESLFQKRQGDESECNTDAKIGEQDKIGALIAALVDQGFHLCASCTTPIAAGFHGHGKIIGAAEGRNKKRHKQRYKALDLLDEIFTLEISAAGDLRLHDLVRLFHQNGNKAKCDRHHHSNFVYGDSHSLQRIEQALNGVCQLIGSRRECHQGRSDHQQ